MKVLLAMRHETIPGTLHFHEPSPHIPWDRLPVEVVGDPRNWGRGEKPRYAGVSSFGISGTNVHVVLEEPPSIRPKRVDGPSAPAYPVLVSARTPEALLDQIRQLRDTLSEESEGSIQDLAFSLATTRTHFPVRAGWSVSSVEELLEKMHAVVETPTNGTGKVGFLFSGQGAQRLKMGRELLELHPVFRAKFNQVAEIVDPMLEYSLAHVLFGASDELLHQTAYAQPALFAFEVALYALWESWGVRPDLVMGHSLGEIVAAHVAGVFSLQDAAELVVTRGRLMQELPTGGAMASVALDADSTKALMEDLGLRETLSLAGINSPKQTVVSGTQDAIEFIAHCERHDIRSQRLTVSHAFHSHLMDPMLEKFRKIAQAIEYQAPNLPWVGNLTGKLMADEPTHADCGSSISVRRSCLRSPFRPLWKRAWVPSLRLGQIPYFVVLACGPTAPAVAIGSHLSEEIG